MSLSLSAIKIAKSSSKSLFVQLCHAEPSPLPKKTNPQWFHLVHETTIKSLHCKHRRFFKNASSWSSQCTSKRCLRLCEVLRTNNSFARKAWEMPPWNVALEINSSFPLWVGFFVGFALQLYKKTGNICQDSISLKPLYLDCRGLWLWARRKLRILQFQCQI